MMRILERYAEQLGDDAEAPASTATAQATAQAVSNSDALSSRFFNSQNDTLVNYDSSDAEGAQASASRRATTRASFSNSAGYAAPVESQQQQQQQQSFISSQKQVNFLSPYDRDASPAKSTTESFALSGVSSDGEQLLSTRRAVSFRPNVIIGDDDSDDHHIGIVDYRSATDDESMLRRRSGLVANYESEAQLGTDTDTDTDSPQLKEIGFRPIEPQSSRSTSQQQPSLGSNVAPKPSAASNNHRFRAIEPEIRPQQTITADEEEEDYDQQERRAGSSAASLSAPSAIPFVYEAFRTENDEKFNNAMRRLTQIFGDTNDTGSKEQVSTQNKRSLKRLIGRRRLNNTVGVDLQAYLRHAADSAALDMDLSQYHSEQQQQQDTLDDTAGVDNESITSSITDDSWDTYAPTVKSQLQRQVNFAPPSTPKQQLEEYKQELISLSPQSKNSPSVTVMTPQSSSGRVGSSSAAASSAMPDGISLLQSPYVKVKPTFVGDSYYRDYVFNEKALRSIENVQAVQQEADRILEEIARGVTDDPEMAAFLTSRSDAQFTSTGGSSSSLNSSMKQQTLDRIRDLKLTEKQWNNLIRRVSRPFEKREKTIRKILDAQNKRLKEECVFKPSINENSKRMAQQLPPLLVRQKTAKEIKEKEMERIKKDLEQSELEGCTFDPQINDASKKIPARGVKSFSDWVKDKANKLETFKKEREQQEVQGCTFKPEISSRTKKIMQKQNTSVIERNAEFELNRTSKLMNELANNLNEDPKPRITKKAHEIDRTEPVGDRLYKLAMRSLNKKQMIIERNSSMFFEDDNQYYSDNLDPKAAASNRSKVKRKRGRRSRHGDFLNSSLDDDFERKMHSSLNDIQLYYNYEADDSDEEGDGDELPPLSALNIDSIRKVVQDGLRVQSNALGIEQSPARSGVMTTAEEDNEIQRLEKKLASLALEQQKGGISDSEGEGLGRRRGDTLNLSDLDSVDGNETAAADENGNQISPITKAESDTATPGRRRSIAKEDSGMLSEEYFLHDTPVAESKRIVQHALEMSRPRSASAPGALGLISADYAGTDSEAMTDTDGRTTSAAGATGMDSDSDDFFDFGDDDGASRARAPQAAMDKARRTLQRYREAMKQEEKKSK